MVVDFIIFLITSARVHSCQKRFVPKPFTNRFGATSQLISMLFSNDLIIFLSECNQFHENVVNLDTQCLKLAETTIAQVCAGARRQWRFSCGNTTQEGNTMVTPLSCDSAVESASATPNIGPRSVTPATVDQYKMFDTKWCKLFKIQLSDGSTMPCLSRSMDPNSNGLGCHACHKAAEAGVISGTIWSRYSVTGRTKAGIQLEDLKRHLNLSKGQAAGKIPLDKHHGAAMDFIGARLIDDGGNLVVRETPSDQSFSRLTFDQIKIVLELCKGWGGHSLHDYLRRCASARASGAAIPEFRCGEECGRQIAISMAEVLFDEDRDDYASGRVAESGFAFDKDNTLLLQKIRMCMRDWSVKMRLFDLAVVGGDRASQAADDVKESLKRFCCGRPELPLETQEKIRSSIVDAMKDGTSDGAPAAQLALRVMKAREVWVNMDFITRASEHSAILCLKSTVKKCPGIEEAVHTLVHGYGKMASTGETACPGGLARHLGNSPKAAELLGKRAQQESLASVQKLLAATTSPPPVASAAGGSSASRATGERPAVRDGNMSFSMPRFDSLVDPLSNIFLKLFRPSLFTLGDLAVAGGRDGKWALSILDTAFTYYPNVLAAMFTDISNAGKNWAHLYDQKRKDLGYFGSCANTRRFNDSFRKTLDRLVGNIDEPMTEQTKAPLLLNVNFKSGCAQTVLQTLRSTVYIQIPDKPTRAIGWPATWAEQVAPLAEVRLWVRLIKSYMAFVFPCEALQESLAPFDLEGWKADPRQAIEHLERAFEPLCKCRGADLKLAAAEYLSVQPLVEEIRLRGVTDLCQYWGGALKERDAASTMPNLTKLARPAFAVWEGNGNLEGDFSRFERIRLEARGCNSELTRAIAKICVDGMRPDLLSKAQLGTALGPQSFVLRVQEKYVALYGERDYAAGEKKRKELAVPFDPPKQRCKTTKARRRDGVMEEGLGRTVT